MNPRLQVEHGLTEELTGTRPGRAADPDRPRREARRRAAAARGCAIEARVCAEDPEADFLPAPGRIVRFDPALGPGVRIDTGVAAGCDVPPDFDSLIAKVIGIGDTREAARARLAAALSDFELVVEGGATNKGYLCSLIEHERFRRAEVDTEWLDREPALRAGSQAYAVPALCAAAVLAYQRHRDQARRKLLMDPSHLGPTSVPASIGQRVDLSYRGESYRLHVYAVGAWRYRVQLDGLVVPVELRSDGPDRGTLVTGGKTLRLLHDGNDQRAARRDRRPSVPLLDRRRGPGARGHSRDGRRTRRRARRPRHGGQPARPARGDEDGDRVRSADLRRREGGVRPRGTAGLGGRAPDRDRARRRGRRALRPRDSRSRASPIRSARSSPARVASPTCCARKRPPKPSGSPRWNRRARRSGAC